MDIGWGGVIFLWLSILFVPVSAIVLTLVLQSRIKTPIYLPVVSGALTATIFVIFQSVVLSFGEGVPDAISWLDILLSYLFLVVNAWFISVMTLICLYLFKRLQTRWGRFRGQQ